MRRTRSILAWMAALGLLALGWWNPINMAIADGIEWWELEPDLDSLSVDTLIINVIIEPDDSAGADVGSDSLTFSHGYFDSLYGVLIGKADSATYADTAAYAIEAARADTADTLIDGAVGLGSLDIAGDLDVDGLTEVDSLHASLGVTIDGTLEVTGQITGDVTGDLTGNADTATFADSAAAADSCRACAVADTALSGGGAADTALVVITSVQATDSSWVDDDLTVIGTVKAESVYVDTTCGPNLITNGTFDTDTDWTKGTGWTIAAGVASYSSGGGAIYQAISGYEANVVYRVAFTTSYVGYVSVGATATIYSGNYLYVTAGTHDFITIGGSSGSNLLFSLNGTGTLDDVSIRRVYQGVTTDKVTPVSNLLSIGKSYADSGVVYIPSRVYIMSPYRGPNDAGDGLYDNFGGGEWGFGSNVYTYGTLGAASNISTSATVYGGIVYASTQTAWTVPIDEGLSAAFNAGDVYWSPAGTGAIEYGWADLSSRMGAGSSLDSVWCYYSLADATDSLRIRILRRPHAGGGADENAATAWIKGADTGRIEAKCGYATMPTDSLTMLVIEVEASGTATDAKVITAGYDAKNRRL